ncbi:protein ADM2a [Acanthopagrus latus]|uniref:protein ADM2a n=1 Tax=Acanthopagrus latus TaxID=8177 RepID=UPI00187D013B|nr:protein ADM2a [Acanthopagrus latus]
MRSLLPLTVYCISLVSLQQLLALPAEERPDRNRLDLLHNLDDQRGDRASASGSQTHITVPSPVPSQSPKWLPGFMRHQPASGVRTASASLAWARPAEASQIEKRALRARRHAHSGSRGGHHHAQLMRVGCVLGTCQVQNLSHRLYQLIGQSGREDSSPINPRSPHSYG